MLSEIRLWQHLEKVAYLKEKLLSHRRLVKNTVVYNLFCEKLVFYFQESKVDLSFPTITLVEQERAPFNLIIFYILIFIFYKLFIVTYGHLLN